MGPASGANQRSESTAPLSPGEVHFLSHFVDGGIMDVDTRLELRRAWGLCARHAFAYLAAEAAYRGVLLGAAVLFDDLMQHAETALGERGGGRVAARLAARRLRASGSCLMCKLGYGPGSTAARAEPAVIRRGSRLAPIVAFARATRPEWQRWVCGRCAATDAPSRCRVHLREDLAHGHTLFGEHRDHVRELAAHVRRFARSFMWELRGTATDLDRASLVGSVGWCSGWRPWIALVAGGDASWAPDARPPAGT
jgi:hypothetical protein